MCVCVVKSPQTDDRVNGRSSYCASDDWYIW